jgi:hypothetical protein
LENGGGEGRRNGMRFGKWFFVKCADSEGDDL